jgi:hypothetical protein
VSLLVFLVNSSIYINFAQIWEEILHEIVTYSEHSFLYENSLEKFELKQDMCSSYLRMLFH